MSGNDKQSETLDSEDIREETPVFEVEQGVGNYIGGKIYVHRLLKQKDPELYNYVVNHELYHAQMAVRAFFSKRDFLHDFAAVPLGMLKRLLKFTFSTRGAYWQLLPLRKIYLPDEKESVIMFDAATMVSWIIIFAAVGLIAWAM